jgi:uncharacterized membrane protein YjgN (DUF898 family)
MPYKKIFFWLLLAAFCLTALATLVPIKTFAQVNELKSFGNEAYGSASATYQEQGPVFIAGKIINALLGVVGIIMVILFIYGGFLWMTAGGNEERVKKATQVLSRAVIGLIIILLAYSISYFVMQQVLKSTGAPMVP